MRTIDVCPGTLAPGFDGYSPLCLRKLFGGQKVSPFLDFDIDGDHSYLLTAVNRISISGVQEKLSAVIREGKIVPTSEGEPGRYIIKPVPGYKHLRFRGNIPANEHLTMQIASQIYKLKTAENAMVFFANGEPAYLTKRFDYTPDGQKVAQDDFASIMGKTVHSHGEDFKYTGSYEDAADLLRQHVAAWRVEISRYFALVVFNYLFGNGDAHLKNFSLQETPAGDFVLTPAYDLMNTAIHIEDGDFALQDGLIPRSAYSEVYERTGHPCQDDFITFGQRIGVPPQKVAAVIDLFSTEQPGVYELTEHSFLEPKVKRMYKQSYCERLRRFQRSDG